MASKAKVTKKGKTRLEQLAEADKSYHNDVYNILSALRGPDFEDVETGRKRQFVWPLRDWVYYGDYTGGLNWATPEHPVPKSLRGWKKQLKVLSGLADWAREEGKQHFLEHLHNAYESVIILYKVGAITD